MPNVFLMITDHGTHSALKWTDMISQMIFPISPTIAPEKLERAKSAQVNIAEYLVPLAQEIIDRERHLLELERDLRLAALHDGNSFVDRALEVIYQVTDRTQWADYMRSVEQVLRSELTRHFNALQNVERLWYADNSEAGLK